jgi:hypothetical protein
MAEILSFARHPHPSLRGASDIGPGVMAATGNEIRARSPGSGAREDLRKTIILLDLALQHAFDLSRQIADPVRRRSFDLHLNAIEVSLQIARDRLAKT